MYKKPGPWKYWGYRPAPRPANSITWEQTTAIEKALDRVLVDPDADVRLAVLKRMQREKVPVRLEPLAVWLRTERRSEHVAGILAALADQPPQSAGKLFDQVIGTREHSAANRLTALDLRARGGGDELHRELLSLAGSLEDGSVLADVFHRLAKHAEGVPPGLFAAKLGSPDPQVRAAAIEALGETRAPMKEKELRAVLGDGDVRVRRAAARAAGKVQAEGAIEPLLKLAADPDVGVRLACLESLRLRGELRVVPLAVAALAEPALEVKALECLAELGGVPQVKAVSDYARRGPSVAGNRAAVQTLTAWQKHTATEEERRELDRAIAVIHGTGGILTQLGSPARLLPATPRRS